MALPLSCQARYALSNKDSSSTSLAGIAVDIDLCNSLPYRIQYSRTLRSENTYKTAKCICDVLLWNV